MSAVAARTDDDITDEAAGRARIAAAAASKERKAAEAAKLKKENEARKAALKNQGAKADDDIMDEEAGRARLRLAEESKARKAAEAERIARENREYRERLKNTKARTDDDITDDKKPGGRPQSPTKMTAAAVYSQYRKPPPKANPDARDGHITDYERKMAARGDDISDFPWSTWATPDWKNGSARHQRIVTPEPSSATHTKEWLKWYGGFSTRRGKQMTALTQTEVGSASPPASP